MVTWPEKDPDAEKDYAIDWSARLLEGETITNSAWAVESTPVESEDPPLLVIEVDAPHAPAIDAGVCTCWLSGGTAGIKYKVTNRITTSRGLIDDQTATIKVKEQ